MKIGIQHPRFTHPGGASAIGPTLGEIARQVDTGGFASFWVMDHFFQIEGVGEAEEPMLEGYSALSYVAALTERVQLGTLVTGVTYRHPGILAKTVTTLDVLSGGRAWLGIGAAWYDREHAGLGIPYPPTAERFERLEETIQVIQQMWSEEAGPFDGRYYHLAETLNSPQPISQPHPPIMIGGTGERKTLRLVAQYADASNMHTSSINELRHKLDVLRRHCDEVGRDYDAIEKTTILPLRSFDTAGTDEALDEIRAQAEVGIDHVILSAVGIPGGSAVDLIAERVVVPAAGIVPSGR